MSVPKKRISKSRTRSRRSHHALTAPAQTTCVKCGSTVRPHYACTACGYYRGKDVLKKQEKVEKKLKKKTAPQKEAAKKAEPKAQADSKKKKAAPKTTKKETA